MVHADKYHPLPEQSRSVPLEIASIPLEHLLPRLLGRQRCEPRCQVPPLAVQPSEPRTSEPIPSVSPRL